MEVIALDMIGVIVQERKLVSEHLYGMLPSPQVTREELKRRYDDGLSVGDMSEEEFWHGVTLEDWRLVRERFLASIKVDDHAKEVLDGLRHDYRLCIVSDMVGEWGRALMSAHSLSEDLEVQIYSSDTKVTKRDGKIYARLIDALGVEAENILYVDDQLKNVTTAQSFGIASVLFENSTQTDPGSPDVLHSLLQLPSLARQMDWR